MDCRLRIGFVAGRLAGTDGVSLEARKWHQVLSRMKCECFCFCGETNWPEDRAFLSETASFTHETVARVSQQLFVNKQRTAETGRCINKLKEHLKGELRQFVRRFDINFLIAENTLSLPMNIPLGLALAELIAETQLPTIAHHHDFWWERQRYAGSPAEDYLRSAFPPSMSIIRHVVINSVAERELAYRTGGKSTLIPNAMDFGNPPEPPDDYAADLRHQVGIRDNEHLILQPTRIVPRKRIEKAVELVRRLNTDCALVVTHEAGDEGHDYLDYLKTLADIMNVRLLPAAEQFDSVRRRSGSRGKVYSIRDAYQAGALVTYCSSLEGFGNAFLEAVYYRKPILMSAYEIFSMDIAPKGFQVLSFQDFIPDSVVRQAEQLLDEPESMYEACEKNFDLGRKHYSFETLEETLHHIIGQGTGKN